MKYRNKKKSTTTIHTDHLLYLQWGVNKKCQKAFNLLASLWYFRLHILNCAIESCVCDGFYCCCCYICQFEIFNGLLIHAPKIYHFIESKYLGEQKKKIVGKYTLTYNTKYYNLFFFQFGYFS